MLAVPTALKVEGDGKSQPYTLRWTAPIQRKAGAITGYSVQMRPQGSIGWQVLCADTRSKQPKLTLQKLLQLDARTAPLQFRVAAHGDAAQSSYSDGCCNDGCERAPHSSAW